MLATRRFRRVVQACTCIQASSRGMRSRERLWDLSFAATCVQAAWRRYNARQLLQCARGAIIAIQSMARRTFAATAAGARYLALLEIQSAARRALAIKRAHGLRAFRAAIMLQSATRRMAAQRLATRRRWRRDAVGCIQRLARGWATRRHLGKLHAAATFIIAHVRGGQAKVAFFAALLATEEMQRFARGLTARAQRRKATRAVLRLQAAARGAVDRRVAWRQMAARRLQAAARARFARELLRTGVAARRLQALARMASAVRKMAAARHAACTVQRRVRARQLERRARVVVVQLQRAARRFLKSDVIPYRRRVLHACYSMRASPQQLIVPAMKACRSLEVLHAHARCRLFAMDLSLLSMLLRLIGSSNRSPHSMELLKMALPLVLCLVGDEACRPRIRSHLEVADVMMKLLISHFGHALYFGLAADVMLADPVRMRAEIQSAAADAGSADGIVWKKRQLLTRLEAEQAKENKGKPQLPSRAPSKTGSAAATKPTGKENPAKKRNTRLVSLLR